ncbi:MAG TPA: hypothetical protein VIM59_09465 [Cellvibrio sp.]
MLRIIFKIIIFLYAPFIFATQNVSINAIAAKSELSSSYCVTLLEMALNASKQENEFISIKFTEFNYPQARLLRELDFVSNSVAWSMADEQRNSSLIPIKIPLFKGLLGMRVFLIREDDQAKFDKVKTLEDLNHFIAGQGAHWPDTKILRENGLRVVTAMDSKSLLKMLKRRRFDYFPRGVTEAWYDVDLYQDDSLVVERNILLAYPSDLYFYVAAGNKNLASRIENGLEKLINSGEFDRYFYSHPRVKESLRNLESNRRRIFYLESNDNKSTMYRNNANYWYRPYTELSTISLQNDLP